VRFDFGTETYILHDAPWQIEDSPRFPHRGLMVDTARHWQPVASLKAIVDSLAYAKLNVPFPEHEYVDEKYGLTETYLRF
jgi:hexosaminidase